MKANKVLITRVITTPTLDTATAELLSLGDGAEGVTVGVSVVGAGVVDGVVGVAGVELLPPPATLTCNFMPALQCPGKPQM